jgi:hypothetical protein
VASKQRQVDSGWWRSAKARQVGLLALIECLIVGTPKVFTAASAAEFSES